jgi:hypothetical protein
MAYLVTCTFDLKNASRTDYQNAYADLQKLGLKKVILSDGGKEVVVPTTMTIGTFDGQGAGPVRDYVRDKIQAAFRAGSGQV